MSPIASIEQQRVFGSGHPDRSRARRTRRCDLLLQATALLIAHGLAALALVLGLNIWSDWRSANQSVDLRLVLALASLFCLNPFAALGISAMLESPLDARRFATTLIPRLAGRLPRGPILLIGSGLLSAALLGTFTLLLVLRLL